jgi:flagellar biosynthesis protein FliR
MGNAPTRPPQSGAVAWGLGLLAIVPFPFVSAVAASVTMAAVGRAQRKNGSIAAANGRNAANWGLTYLALSVALIAVHFLVLHLFTQGAPQTHFFPIGIPITIWGLVSLVFVIVCIVGLSRSNKGAVFAAPAIPFVRS